MKPLPLYNSEFDATTYWGTMRVKSGDIVEYECHRGKGDDNSIYIVIPGSDKILMWCTMELWNLIYQISDTE